MKRIPKTANPLVIRADFENQPAWDAICKVLRAPIHLGGVAFHANLNLLEDPDYRDRTIDQLLAMVPPNYDHTFFLVVDRMSVSDPQFPILIVDLHGSRGRSFRAIPSTIQGIENNLSLANMGFEEFAEAVDSDGIFRGFPEV